MGDDVPMADTHEILPVYQQNTKSAFNAYKVCVFMRRIQRTAHESANWMEGSTVLAIDGIEGMYLLGSPAR